MTSMLKTPTALASLARLAARAAPYLMLMASTAQASHAAAADNATRTSMARVVEVAKAFLSSEARLLAAPYSLTGPVTATLLPPDANQSFPACTALHAFLPPGAKARGRTTVGIRCAAPVAWTFYLPATVNIPCNYVVTRRALRAGLAIGETDVESTPGDLGVLPENTLADPAQAIGQSTRQAVAAGQPLLATMLRPSPVIRQGETVRIVGQGAGFSIFSEGRALNSAALGENVRLRLENGEVINATAQADGKAALTF